MRIIVKKSNNELSQFINKRLNSYLKHDQDFCWNYSKELKQTLNRLKNHPEPEMIFETKEMIPTMPYHLIWIKRIFGSTI